MVDILHRVGIESPNADRTFDALTTVDGLSSWWTEKTSGDATTGGVLRFRFDEGGFDMRVQNVEPQTFVRWEVVDGPAEWVGTTISWQLRQQGGRTVVLFAHQGWREPVEFMYQCSTKWATFLMSLKSLVETGSGSPAPNDVKIGEWD